VRFFLGFGLVGLGSVRCGSAMSSKMGLFQNGKDNWVGVISSFLRVSCWWSSILGIISRGEDAIRWGVGLDVEGLSEGVPVWHLK
jgi:hypothetical protein